MVFSLADEKPESGSHEKPDHDEAEDEEGSSDVDMPEFGDDQCNACEQTFGEPDEDAHHIKSYVSRVIVTVPLLQCQDSSGSE